MQPQRCNYSFLQRASYDQSYKDPVIYTTGQLNMPRHLYDWAAKDVADRISLLYAAHRCLPCGPLSLCQCIRCGTVWFDKTKCIVSLSFVTRPPRPRHPPSTLSMVAAEHTRASPPASGLWKGNQIPTNRPRWSGGTSTDTTSGEKAECTGLCPGWFGWSLDVFFLIIISMFDVQKESILRRCIILFDFRDAKNVPGHTDTIQ